MNTKTITVLRIVCLAALAVMMVLLLPSPRALGEEDSLLPEAKVFDGRYAALDMTSETGGTKPLADAYTGEMSYEDDSISVEIFRGFENDTNYMVALISISHPSQLRTYHFNDTLGSSAAKRMNAVVAINGDYFSYDSVSYVVRMGRTLRQRPTGEDLLIVDGNGDFHVLRGEEAKTVASIEAYGETLPGGIYQCFSFGPAIVLDGEVSFTEKDIPYTGNPLLSPEKQVQRVAIAQLGPLRYMIVSTEGPEDPKEGGGKCKGFSVMEMAELVARIGKEHSENGCIAAYNLDGGSSNTLVFRNDKVNSPRNPKRRPLNDIIYFATLAGE